MLGVIVVLSRLLLALVFTIAGLTKLRDREGTRRAIVSFGSPKAVAGGLAIVLPVTELAIAFLLLPARTAVYGVIAAIVLLGIFTMAIAVSLARGKAPECRCFGQLHAAPTSWKTLARNGALLALAIVALVGVQVDEPASVVAWIADLSPIAAAFLAAGIAVAATMAVMGAVLLSITRSYGRVLLRLERIEGLLTDQGFDLGDKGGGAFLGVEPGTEAPWFLATTSEGRGVSRDDLLANERPLLLLFTSPHCDPCTDLLPVVARWQREHDERLTVAVACSADADAVRAQTAKHNLVNVLVDEHRAIADAFEVSATPSAVLIAADGTIRSWLVNGREGIESLVTSATAPPSGIPVGTRPPTLELTTLDDEPFTLAQLQGRDAVLLFWNPGCGYCRELHADLLAFEEREDASSPRLIVISSGNADDTRADGFRSTVVLDTSYIAGTAFDAGGTPMAVLVGVDGRVASEVAAGGDAVLALLGLGSPELSQGGTP